jgi:GAF domain-containing protein
MSPTDPAPVFEAILESALRLCKAPIGGVCLSDGQVVSLAALRAPADSVEVVRATFPRRLEDVGIAVRAIREGRIVHLADVLQESSSHHVVDEAIGVRGELAVPMWREGRCIGAITMARPEPGLFSESQVALIRTLADQAAIAVENVRLFTETKEALEQQTATAEILRVISSSPTDVQPVFDTIVKNVVRLCDAVYSTVFRVDEGRIDLVAHHNIPPEGLEELRRRYPAPLSVTTGSAQAARERVVVQISDVENDPTVTEDRRRLAGIVGYRSQAWVPMLKGDRTLGVIGVSRREAEPFPAQHIALLQTFADQAVIAIENVRLFTELEARNRELTESLEQQTATSDVLKVISRSTFDLQPVLKTLVESAVSLCGADRGFVYRQDGDRYGVAAAYGGTQEYLELSQRNPITLDRGSATGRALLERRVIHIHDTMADPEHTWAKAERGAPVRTVLAAPMLRADTIIGVIEVERGEVRPFSDKQVELVTTFADQAVIAIENVRLFKELEARNRDLTESLEQQTATGEILRVISSSPTDLQPVMEAIAENAARVCGATNSSIYRLEGKHLRLVARRGSLRRPRAIGDAVPVGRGFVSGRVVIEN